MDSTPTPSGLARPRCTVGDRCFVIKAHFAENVGRIVRVTGLNLMDTTPGDVWWNVVSEGSPMKGETDSGRVSYTMELIGPDSSLLPIRPEPTKARRQKRAVA
jgi:hypothetical protein